MRFNMPKPLHGWRAFAGEVGIIVLGVLLALGAQQFVEDLNSRQNVRQTRAAIDAELSHDLAALQFRLNQRDCVSHRLSELDRWSRAIGNGQSLRLRKPIDPPIFFALRTAVWDSTTGEVTSRMPLDAKLNYASMYGAMKTLQSLLDDEGNQWATIQGYGANRDLDRRELHDVQSAIAELRSSNDLLSAFETRTGEFAEKLGVKPEADMEGRLKEQTAQRNRQFCEPLL
ncbi:MAG TPA: hypothetical protein VH392_00745 [Sphingomicrobium sp.]